VRICHCRALEFVGNLNLPSKVLKFWYSIAGIRRHWLDSSNHYWNPATHIPTKQTGIQPMPEFGNLCRNLATSDHNCQFSADRILAKLARIWPVQPKSGSTVPYSGQFGRNLVYRISEKDSSHLHRNLANQHSGETCPYDRNLAIVAGFQPPSRESGNSS
jgi:hypothetical protein